MKPEGLKDITLQQLEALLHLVEERSFSAAAKRLSVTQPSLTKHIKNLEAVVGARVVNRQARGITLTAEGKVLRDYARRILRLREEARETIGRVREDESGNIFVSASTIPATYLLPRALVAFRQSHPDIRFFMKSADSKEVVEMILGSQGEIGFVGMMPRDGKLQVEPLWKDRLVLAVPAGHPFLRRGFATLRELSREPFILREKGSATRESFEGCLAGAKGVKLSGFNVVSEVGSSEAVKEAIMAGLGVSVLSVHAVARELGQGTLAEVPLRGCRIERYFYLIYRRQFALMHHHHRFLYFIRNYRPENVSRPAGG